MAPLTAKVLLTSKMLDHFILEALWYKSFYVLILKLAISTNIEILHLECKFR